MDLIPGDMRASRYRIQHQKSKPKHEQPVPNDRNKSDREINNKKRSSVIYLSERKKDRLTKARVLTPE